MSNPATGKNPDTRNNAPRSLSSTGCLAGALFGGLTIASLLITGFVAESTLGRASSTSGIVIVFVPIYGGITAAAGALVGYLIGAFIELITRGKELSRVTHAAIIAVPALVGMIAAAAFVTRMTIDYEETNQPGVIYSDGRLTKTAVDESAHTAADADETLWGKYIRVPWNDAIAKIHTSEHAVRIDRSPEASTIVTTLEDYDYVREAAGIAVELEPDAEYLAVIADLRATGNRAMLLVYDWSGELIYQEHLERPGRRFDLQSVSLEDGREGFIVVTKNAHLYSF